MQYVRLLNYRSHYSPEQRRFTSRSFTKYGGGISVFLKSCAEETSRTICEHIKRFYSPSPAGNPPIYWIIEREDLINFESFQADGIDIVQSDSHKGDVCHYDIIPENDNKDKKAAKFKESFGEFKDNYSPEIYVCCGTGLIKLTKESCENLLETIRHCIEPEVVNT